jgi:hypothetical protein
MTTFPKESNYTNVNEIAEAQGLIWDGHFGGPYGIPELVDSSIDYEKVVEPWERLFDHTVRLKPRGSGNKRAVFAIASPYKDNDDALSVAAHDCARALGLEVRVGDERDRVYVIPGTTPILFWRSDLHELK